MSTQDTASNQYRCWKESNSEKQICNRLLPVGHVRRAGTQQQLMSALPILHPTAKAGAGGCKKGPLRTTQQTSVRSTARSGQRQILQVRSTAVSRSKNVNKMKKSGTNSTRSRMSMCRGSGHTHKRSNSASCLYIPRVRPYSRRRVSATANFRSLPVMHRAPLDLPQAMHATCPSCPPLALPLRKPELSRQ